VKYTYTALEELFHQHSRQEWIYKNGKGKKGKGENGRSKNVKSEKVKGENVTDENLKG